MARTTTTTTGCATRRRSHEQDLVVDQDDGHSLIVIVDRFPPTHSLDGSRSRHGAQQYCLLQISTQTLQGRLANPPRSAHGTTTATTATATRTTLQRTLDRVPVARGSRSRLVILLVVLVVVGSRPQSRKNSPRFGFAPSCHSHVQLWVFASLSQIL